MILVGQYEKMLFMMVVNLKQIGSFLFLIIFFIRCNTNTPQKSITDIEVATKWADMTLYIAKNTFANTPTYASRAFGYIGISMYESVVHSNPKYQSLAGQLNQLDSLPKPLPGQKYNWGIALNASQSFIIKEMYRQTEDENKLKIDSLEQVIYKHLVKFEVDEPTAIRSVEYGKIVAKTIYEWSKKDGGDRGYLNNFDPKFILPEKSGVWKPALFSQVVGHQALHPHWGKNRTFLKIDGEIETPKFLTYATNPQSEYCKYNEAVKDKNKSLTQTEKEIAMWWNDDPSDTYTPPGHSYNFGTMTVKKVNPDLVKVAQTYAKIGMAVADAFIVCWKWKYLYLSERPSTYINEILEETWESFWPNPPFPSFPSGHSIQAAATAMVLTDSYGDDFAFIDSSHVGRPRDEDKQVDYKPRAFISFWQAAEETAKSRFYGGIHTEYDNIIGLAKGKIIGTNINALEWLKN